jgi:hypothetical protein
MTVTVAAGLDASQRSTLEQLVARARRLLENDLAAQVEGRFGIHLDGTIEDEGALPDDTTDKGTRRDLEQIVAHLRTLGEDALSAVARLLREAAFTHLNRLVAIRIAEAIGLLPESLASGPQSRGFKNLGEIMPMLAGDYRAYVRLCGDELAGDAPALFDPRNPLLALQPSTAAFDELVALVADPQTMQIWHAPDTLGWTYQFFNTGDERREMREASAPRNSRELAVRNQFFTPRYVVDFLVQNSLGRRLVEADPGAGLSDDLPLLVDPPEKPGLALALDEVRVLDPACGSGHFLLGCYDLLEKAWRRAGASPAEAAQRILPCLWGIDIDPRCGQVASAALMLRARRACPQGELPPPNIVIARALPEEADAWDVVLAELRSDRRHLAGSLREALRSAPMLGSLLKVEEHLAMEIRETVPEAGGDEGTLFASTGMAADAFGRAESEVLEAAQQLADAAGSTAAQRLFAADAGDALRFVEAVRQRYDVVLMNPPFGRPIDDTRPYLYSAYPSLPPRTADLFAAFVSRGVELCREGGYMGAITSRAGMFLTTFEEWRREFLLRRRLVTLADLGYGVMEQALVEAAAYVIGADRRESEHRATFIRLLKDTDRPTALGTAIADERGGLKNSRAYRVTSAEFDAIPGSPIAYWMAPSVRRLFAKYDSMKDSGFRVRVGLQTSNDARFVRAIWEVDPSHIARDAGETSSGKRWAPFAKGGEYSPYWLDVFLVVDWLDRGRLLWEDVNPKLDKPFSNVWMLKATVDMFFQGGITWSARTNSGFSPRVLPVGAAFSHKGPTLVGPDQERLSLLGWMNSRLVQSLLDALVAAGEESTSGGASRSYEVGLVSKLPWPGRALDQATFREVSAIAEDLAAGRLRQDASDETARRFVRPSVLPLAGAADLLAAVNGAADRESATAVGLVEKSSALERVLHRALGIAPDAEAYLDAEVGPHPASYSKEPLDDEGEFARLFAMPIDQVIDEVVARKGGSRSVANLTFVADRRLEVLAHAFERNPRVLDEARQRMHLLPPGEPRRSAEDLFSYMVGAAFGRWDVRIGRNTAPDVEQPDAFHPVPICQPGMLTASDGLPPNEAPPNYPLEFPPSRLLVDEVGHAWDVEAAVLRAADALFEDPFTRVAQMLEILGRKSVRDYLRRQFFKDHISRYTKSRRKAPIYWPLTVPSKMWGVWVYAPTLTRQTLYAVAGEAGRRERYANEEIERLQREHQEGGAGRSVRNVVAELDAEENLAEELRRFRTEAETIAGMGWKPDLDDGILLCAAPLADLLPAWSELNTARSQLRKGKYEWATVGAWADQL